MSQQDLEPQQPAQPAAPAAAVEAPVAQPERQYDAEYVAGLQRMVSQQQAELNRYEPLKDDIAWMTEDETRLAGIRRYRQSYEDALKPEVPPALADLYKHIDERTEPSRNWVEQQQRERAAREQADRDKFVAENVTYANRLVSEKKIKPDQIDGLAAYADSLAHRWQRNVTIEEAYKTGQSAFGGVPQTEAAKAPVLRADDGQGGVPGPSETDSKRWVSDFHGSLVDALKAEKRTA